MNIADIIVILLIAALIVYAVTIIHKNKKKGKNCGGDCANCGACNKKEKY